MFRHTKPIVYIIAPLLVSIFLVSEQNQVLSHQPTCRCGVFLFFLVQIVILDSWLHFFTWIPLFRGMTFAFWNFYFLDI